MVRITIHPKEILSINYRFRHGKSIFLNERIPFLGGGPRCYGGHYIPWRCPSSNYACTSSARPDPLWLSQVSVCALHFVDLWSSLTLFHPQLGSSKAS